MICADGYGLSQPVSTAIVALIEEQRILATSCLAVAPLWPSTARWLDPVAGRADVGVHLALTDFRPLGRLPRLAPWGRLPDAAVLRKRNLLGRIGRDEVRAELVRQLDRFLQQWGTPPDFVDSHQHVHLLSGIRAPLLEALEIVLPGRAMLLRDTRPSVPLFEAGVLPARRALSNAWQALGWAQAARSAGHVTNEGFAALDAPRDLEEPGAVLTTLKELGPRPILAVQPARSGNLADRLSLMRAAQYDYLMSDQLAHDLFEAGRMSVRLAGILPVPRAVHAPGVAPLRANTVADRAHS